MGVPVKLHASFDDWKHEPGDAFWARVMNSDGTHPCFWDNCDGRHLWVVLPNLVIFDLSARASNCGSPTDRLHRCWVIHENPLHVDKNGRTCSAGAGSLLVGPCGDQPGWHGFLHNGELIG